MPILAIGVAGVQSAATQEAAVQQVEKIYGDAADTVKDFAENTALSFNMSTSDAYKYAQIYGNLIQSITDDEEENAKYTQQLLEASSIIASATSRTMEDVMDRIRSGLLGNTEAIEDLGVNVNVAMIESTDSFKKFAGDKSWRRIFFPCGWLPAVRRPAAPSGSPVPPWPPTSAGRTHGTYWEPEQSYPACPFFQI